MSVDEHTERVASYETLEGAERAVTHLVGLGFDEADVGIGPRHFHEERTHPLLHRVRTAGGTGTAVGAVLGAVVALISLVGVAELVGHVGVALVVGAAVGAIAGLALALVDQWRDRRRRFTPPPPVLVPSAYEVRVSEAPEEANHRLARWWDPAARPAGSR